MMNLVTDYMVAIRAGERAGIDMDSALPDLILQLLCWSNSPISAGSVTKVLTEGLMRLSRTEVMAVAEAFVYYRDS